MLTAQFTIKILVKFDFFRFYSFSYQWGRFSPTWGGGGSAHDCGRDLGTPKGISSYANDPYPTIVYPMFHCIVHKRTNGHFLPNACSYIAKYNVLLETVS